MRLNSNESPVLDSARSVRAQPSAGSHMRTCKQDPGSSAREILGAMVRQIYKSGGPYYCCFRHHEIVGLKQVQATEGVVSENAPQTKATGCRATILTIIASKIILPYSYFPSANFPHGCNREEPKMSNTKRWFSGKAMCDILRCSHDFHTCFWRGRTS